MTDHGYTFLAAQIGASCAELVGAYLPCEYPFMWHYPHVPISILSRRVHLAPDEQLDFCYALLQDAKYRDELVFSAVLLQRALHEGCRARLDNLKPLMRHDARVTYFDDVSIDGMRWLVDNAIAVDQYVLREYMIKTPSNYERNILMFLLNHKIEIAQFDRPHISLNALRWFFDHPHLLYISTHTRVSLDNKSDREVRLWLEHAPLESRDYVGKRVVDYTDTAEMLEYLFRKLRTFRYSQEAIAVAIAENNIEVLEWWTQKAREGQLQLMVPDNVQYGHALSPRVEHWARQYNVRLVPVLS